MPLALAGTGALPPGGFLTLRRLPPPGGRTSGAAAVAVHIVVPRLAVSEHRGGQQARPKWPAGPRGLHQFQLTCVTGGAHRSHQRQRFIDIPGVTYYRQRRGAPVCQRHRQSNIAVRAEGAVSAGDVGRHVGGTVGDTFHRTLEVLVD
jgi:hypothetical protein